MAYEFLNLVYFGNTLFQYLQFFLILILSLVVGKIGYFFLRNYFVKFASKTSSKIDDVFLHAIDQPLIVFVFLAGLSIGLSVLTFDAEAEKAIQNFLGAGMTLGIAWFLIKLVEGFAKEIIVPLTSKSESKLDDQLVPVIRRALKIVIVIIAVIVIADTYFGVDVTAPLVGLGIGGIAIAFAAQQTIADVFGGISIFTSKPFVIGDMVSFENVTGKVEQVGLRQTRIRTLDQQYLTVPNSKISTSIITNLTDTTKRRVSLNIGVTYDTSVKKIEEAKLIIRQILHSIDLIEKDPEPIVVFNEFKDSSLNIFVLYFILTTDWPTAQKIKDQINIRIKTEFEKARIEFAYPTQTVYVKK